MQRLLIIIVIILLALINAGPMLSQQFQKVTVSTVMAFAPGSGQNSGQGPAFFPQNIFGLPDTNASDSTPATDPRSICSIGLGGSIIVGFKNYVIADGPGEDFIVFENAFKYLNNRIYAEPAVISVSKDGITWYEFPHDDLTLAGCAGKTPTYGGDPFNPSEGGGDAFDLAALGVDSIRWIRITDITQTILNNPNHPYYDPTLSGFDLDAVVSAHGVAAPTTSEIVIKPKSSNVELNVAEGEGIYRVYNINGIELSREELGSGMYVRSTSEYETTCLFVTLQVAGQLFTGRVLK